MKGPSYHAGSVNYPGVGCHTLRRKIASQSGRQAQLPGTPEAGLQYPLVSPPGCISEPEPQGVGQILLTVWRNQQAKRGGKSDETPHFSLGVAMSYEVTASQPVLFPVGCT